MEKRIENGTIMCEKFNDVYPQLNQHIFMNGDRIESRVGKVAEVLDFKTTIFEPYKRCVGGYKRNINIFFLLAEALWIVNGRRDVYFLTLFNKRMAEFSDDKINFHAPYGWRLRQWGRLSDGICRKTYKESQGIDQIKENLSHLQSEPGSRRAVMQIWNPELDLNTSSLDLPCNDMVFLKIRNGKLNLTIANRSNDLHWGLTTNVFQFSFIGEIMAKCLRIGVGSQVHLSNSLHVYLDNEITSLLINQATREYNNLYQYCEYHPFEFTFSENIDSVKRFEEIDENIEDVISVLIKDSLEASSDPEKLLGSFAPNLSTRSSFAASLETKSRTLFEIYMLLGLYLNYAKVVKEKTLLLEEARGMALAMLIELDRRVQFKHRDYYLLALNFFANRMEKHQLSDTHGDLVSTLKIGSF